MTSWPRAAPDGQCVTDPIETGIVAGLAHPGGNITGVNLMSAALVGKCVELFHDMLPRARQIAVLTNHGDALFAKLVLDQVDLAALPASRSTQLPFLGLMKGLMLRSRK